MSRTVSYSHSICCQRRSEHHLPARSSLSLRALGSFVLRHRAPLWDLHLARIAGKKKYSRDWEFGEGGSSLKRNSCHL
ncbi:hypothetical protein SRHO_G00283160 [Serrasalmus rhombeus]